MTEFSFLLCFCVHLDHADHSRNERTSYFNCRFGISGHIIKAVCSTFALDGVQEYNR